MGKHVAMLVVSGQRLSRANTRERSCDGKGRYTSAEQALRRAQAVSDRSGRRLHVYRCTYCANFHFTGCRPRPDSQAFTLADLAVLAGA